MRKQYEMQKEITIKDDGRELIYYHFTEKNIECCKENVLCKKEGE